MNDYHIVQSRAACETFGELMTLFFFFFVPYLKVPFCRVLSREIQVPNQSFNKWIFNFDLFTCSFNDYVRD